MFHFELVREDQIAKEESVDLNDIFYFAPEAFQTFMFVSTAIQSGELEHLGRNECIYSHLQFQWDLKNYLPYA